MTCCVTRRFQFCAGHRLVDHEGKCAHLHGHNYVAFVTCEAPELDAVGRVIDFSVIKQVIGDWINKAWDHKMILNRGDDEGIAAVRALGDPYYPMMCNPTAENMASEMLQVADGLLSEQHRITVTKVVLWETENCYAEVNAQ